ncbi:MAG: hypothetical protein ACPGUV_11840, partial [Polyangiales bacterium]
RAKRLLQAVIEDDPALAQDLFFPREAFAHVKAMAKPDRYWQRLFARFEADIHTLHTSLPGLTDATFVRVEPARRMRWMPPGSEGNRLPYWAARHGKLWYQSQGKERSFELRVMITWGKHWYIIHLLDW